jgi:cytochrome c553
MQRISIFVVLVLALSSVARAQGIEEKAQICGACHGEDGVPPEQASPVPVIWGQNFGYLFIQLRDFKSGARKSEQMTSIAENLEASELMQLAQYFAKKRWPKLQRADPAPEVAALGERATKSVACVACHLQDFGGDINQPRLAGQARAYLEKTMIDFRTSARANNPGMCDLMKAIGEREIAALAAYLSGL